MSVRQRSGPAEDRHMRVLAEIRAGRDRIELIMAATGLSRNEVTSSLAALRDCGEIENSRPGPHPARYVVKSAV
jgi:DNA-binding IclR family transcriptional regulator